MTDLVKVKFGRGWHARLGPVIVAHHRPPAGAPFLDQGWCSFTDEENPVEPRTVGRFCGWGVRWPRCFVGFGGAIGSGGRLAQSVSNAQGWRRRRRYRNVQPSMMDAGMTPGDDG